MGLTVEGLLLEVGKALEPLGPRLSPDQLPGLFEELGLPDPDAVLGTPQLAHELERAATVLDELRPALDQLASAIAEPDAVALASAVAQVEPIVRQVVGAAEAIGLAVGAAGATSGPARTELEAFARELPANLLGFLVVRHLERHHPAVAGVATLLGVVDVAPQPATAHAPAHVQRTLRLDRLGPLLDDPVGALAELYGWGTPALAWDVLLARLSRLSSRLSGFAFVEPGLPGEPSRLRLGLVDLAPTPDPVPGIRAAVRADLSPTERFGLTLRPGLALEAGLASALEAGAAVEVHPAADLVVVPPTAEVEGQARLGLALSSPDGGRLPLLGTAAGARVEAGRLRISAGADLSWDLPARRSEGAFLVEAAVEDGRVVLGLEGADGFLSALLPSGGVTFEIDVLASWSEERGLRFEGGTGLAVDLPVDLDLGAVRIALVHLALAVEPGGLGLEVSGAISARLGPFALAVDRMGTRMLLSFPTAGDTLAGGNLGVADLVVAFQPPSGLGLSLDAGVVKGGGYLFFDHETGEYAGVLELTLGPVSIKALGILTTRLPGGAPGWALLLAVFGEFPPVQLGFGFTLDGVGGIVGLQHGVSVDALQSGLRSGVLDAVLFPRDPVASAPTLLRQLRVVFPIVPRALTVGPAVRLGWSTPPLVTMSLGLVLQVDDVLGASPGPPAVSRVVLLGQLKIQIPPVDALGVEGPALIQIHVDVLGSYDVEDQALSIDAVLRDSHIALLPITGSLAVRARFGRQPTFILAVGGFHPRFTDVPPGLPAQQRIGFELRQGIVTARLVGYLALTSNTVQAGAEVSLVASGGGFRVEAHLGFDALFVFDPVFHFEIDFRVGAAIKYHGRSLTSVKVRGVLSGPGRWEVTGHASISLFLFDVDIDFEVAWGSAPVPALPTVKVGSLLVAALSSADAWTAQLPGGGAALVSFRSVDPGGEVLAHPLGQLAGIQKVVPLGIAVDRVGRSRPSDGNRFDVTAVEVAGEPQPLTFQDEHFARGEYLDLSEEEKLSRPSFERFRAGVVVSSSEFEVPAIQLEVEPEWETVFLGESRPGLRGTVASESLVAQAAFAAVTRSPLRAAARLRPEGAQPVTVAEAAYTAVRAADPQVAAAGSRAMTFTEASQAVEPGLLVADVAELDLSRSSP